MSALREAVSGAFSIAALTSAAFTMDVARARDEQVLYSFTGGTDGQQPWAGVVLDETGNLYGVATFAGASGNCGPSGCGTVFMLTTAGAFSVLHNFDWDDGANPGGDLIRDKKTGDLYGPTFSGGSGGAGTIFKLATDGTLNTLYSFMGGSDGNTPEGRLVRDGNGNLYGTTYGGGADSMGVVFKVAADGTETVLHAFAGGAKDGAFPTNAGLAMDSSGNLYGMTQFGGGNDYGTVFRLKRSGRFKLLHSFIGGSDGRYPAAGLIIDSAGDLYGTTQGGGGNGSCTYGCGTVFSVAPDGTETVLHAFAGGSDGSNPLSTLLPTKSGAFFGTTDDGSKGTVFKLKPDGREVVLHTFGSARDGFEPQSGVSKDKAGNLYGTTDLGGASGLGTVYTVRK